MELYRTEIYNDVQLLIFKTNEGKYRDLIRYKLKFKTTGVLYNTIDEIYNDELNFITNEIKEL